MTEPRFPRNGKTIAEASAITGLSPRTIRRWTSRNRQDWLQEMANVREEIRAYHDDQGHSWSETAAHYHLDGSTVKRRAYRARKERAAEQLSKTA